MKRFKIFIRNISKSMNTNDLRALFERYGDVDRCDILASYAFVHMTDEVAVNKAISGLNGLAIDGSDLFVTMSTKSESALTNTPSNNLKRNRRPRNMRLSPSIGTIIKPTPLLHSQNTCDVRSLISNNQYLEEKLRQYSSTSRFKVSGKSFIEEYMSEGDFPRDYNVGSSYVPYINDIYTSKSFNQNNNHASYPRSPSSFSNYDSCTSNSNYRSRSPPHSKRKTNRNRHHYDS